VTPASPRPAILRAEVLPGPDPERTICGMARTRSTRKLSTREYGLPISRTWKNANYAYPRGAGADRGKRPSYPIVPKARARAARSFAARKNTAGSLRTVDNAIRHRYGSVRAIYTGAGGTRSSAGRSRASTSRGVGVRMR
jgi:hypothetical protein